MHFTAGDEPPPYMQFAKTMPTFTPNRRGRPMVAPTINGLPLHIIKAQACISSRHRRGYHQFHRNCISSRLCLARWSPLRLTSHATASLFIIHHSLFIIHHCGASRHSSPLRIINANRCQHLRVNIDRRRSKGGTLWKKRE